MANVQFSFKLYKLLKEAVYLESESLSYAGATPRSIRKLQGGLE